MKSKKAFLYVLLIMLLSNFCVQEISGMSFSPEEAKRIDMLLSENSTYVHEEDKKVLEEYKEKLLNYETLTQEEKDYLRECYLNMIKNKLGEQKFNEYCKLIEKRSGSAEFSQQERFRLYELEKEIREMN